MGSDPTIVANSGMEMEFLVRFFWFFIVLFVCRSAEKNLIMHSVIRSCCAIRSRIQMLDFSQVEGGIISRVFFISDNTLHTTRQIF